MPLVLGTNQLPRFFSRETDVELLGACVCGSTRFETICYEWGLGLERCLVCGVVRTNPRLKQSVIQRCYEDNAKAGGENFFTQLMEADDDPGSFAWRDVRKRYRAIARQLLALFLKRRGEAPEVLEVGFGAGKFIEELKNVGFDVHGFDISESAVEKLRSREVAATHSDSLLSAQFPEQSFDLVVMWEVFEHIPDPVAFAKEVRRILKSRGYWFLQVPNWRWLDLKMRITSRLPGKKRYLSKYGLFNPLFHLYHYTYESLRRTLEPQGFVHRKSYRIRLYDENRWQSLVAHELMFLFDLPALVTRNRRHWNVVLAELYQPAPLLG